MTITSPAYYDRPLDPEIKAEWIRRLRSGDYAQTHNVLRGEHGYDCLGVLISLFPEQYPHHIEVIGKEKRHYFLDGGDTPHFLHTDRLYSLFDGPNLELRVPLTPDMVDSLPMDMQNAIEEESEYTISEFLFNLNDNYGWTFPQIATWIEEWL